MVEWDDKKNKKNENLTKPMTRLYRLESSRWTDTITNKKRRFNREVDFDMTQDLSPFTDEGSGETSRLKRLP